MNSPLTNLVEPFCRERLIKMGYLFLLLFLLWLAVPIYVFRYRLWRWWKAEVTNRNLAPHERWPEILQWAKGDEFANGDYHCYKLVSIDSDGYAVVSWLGKLEYAPLSRLVGHNASARTRRINRRLAESNEYMELLNAFNESVAELQCRDEKLKLVS